MNNHSASTATYFNKGLERRIIRHLVVDAVGSNRVIGDILHVRIPEVQRGVEHGSCDTSDCRMLFALDLMERFYQATMVDMQLGKVVEDVLDELL